ncbi:MAG: hypothetical protein ACK4M8_02090 [Allorhizobium sp.]
MISIADNPAVTDPRRALTPSQQDALSSIAFFRFQKPRAGGWAIGNKRFNAATIETLRQNGLLSTTGGKLNLTQAGQLALDKLKGQSQ